MRIKDVEGVQTHVPIWIRPYRAKHQQHLLKTDSAERNLNVQISTNARRAFLNFRHYCQVRRMRLYPKSILFTDVE